RHHESPARRRHLAQREKTLVPVRAASAVGEGTSLMRGRLNLFQATMLRWRELHPYSAVHAVHVASPLDTGRLATAIGRELEVRGLTHLTLDAARARFDYGGGAAPVALAVLPGGTDPRTVLNAEFE